jgi:hypothetical protein
VSPAIKRVETGAVLAVRQKKGILMGIDFPTPINPAVLFGIIIIVLGIAVFAYIGV